MIKRGLQCLPEWSQRAAVPLVGVVLLLAGVLTQGLTARFREEFAQFRPGFDAEALSQSAGSGLSLALLGGFRTLAADVAFLQSYAAWEQRDLDLTQRHLFLAVTLDPRSREFWLRGAQVLALDVPHWRFRSWEAQHGQRPPEAVQQAIRREQLKRAEYFLRQRSVEGLEQRILAWELARMSWSSLREPAVSSAYAAEALQGATVAPAQWQRFYIEMLRLDGRSEDAYEYLRQIFPHLPVQDTSPEPFRPYALYLIRELEAALEYPLSLRLAPQPEENGMVP